MIIHYNKNTGEIIGTVEGFQHDAAALAMKIVPGTLTADDVETLVIEPEAFIRGQEPDEQKLAQVTLAKDLENPKVAVTIKDMEVKNGKLIKRTK